MVNVSNFWLKRIEFMGKRIEFLGKRDDVYKDFKAMLNKNETLLHFLWTNHNNCLRFMNK